jgi:proteasome lid subunit RPN8/RPN11
MIGRKTKKRAGKVKERREEPRVSWRVSTEIPNRTPIGRRRIDFAPFTFLVIPSFCVDYTESLLRDYGKTGRERFLIWAGTLKDDFAFVSTIIVPPNGRGFVSADTVARIYQHLDGRDLVPLAQVHTHPYEAFLSSVDSRAPFFSARGFLSIIIPNFASESLRDLSNWKVYRYLSNKRWKELSRAEIESSVVIDDSAVMVS